MSFSSCRYHLARCECHGHADHCDTSVTPYHCLCLPESHTEGNNVSTHKSLMCSINYMCKCGVGPHSPFGGTVRSLEGHVDTHVPLTSRFFIGLPLLRVLNSQLSILVISLHFQACKHTQTPSTEESPCGESPRGLN